MTNITIETLTEARALIADEKNWIKHESTSVNDVGEMCFCALGALAVAEDKVGRISGGYSALCAAMDPSFAVVSEFNDDARTTHADVLALFDRAIVAEQTKAVSA